MPTLPRTSSGRYPMTVGQRQAGLGPPVDIPYVPLPFQEILALEELGMKKQALAPDLTVKVGDRDRADDPWFVEDYSGRIEQFSDIYEKHKDNINDPIASREFQKAKQDPQYSFNELNRKRSYENINKLEGTISDLESKGLSKANAFAARLKINNWRTPNEQGIAGTRAYGVFPLDLGTITPNKDRNEYIKTLMDEAAKTGSYTEKESGNFYITKGQEGLAYNDLLRMGGLKRVGTEFQIVDPTRMVAYFNDDSGKNLVNETALNYFNSTGKVPSSNELTEIVQNEYINLVNNQAIEKTGFITKQSLQETAEYKAQVGKEGLFGGTFLKSTISPIGQFSKVPKVSDKDEKFFIGGKLHPELIEKEIKSVRNDIEKISKDPKQVIAPGFTERIRIKNAEIQRLENFQVGLLDLREKHNVLSKKYPSDKQFINAVRTATNASGDSKYEASIPQLQFLSDTMWKLASANPLVWGLKDESTGEIIESSASLKDGEGAFSLDPIGNKATFQVGETTYSMQLPDALIPVFNTAKNVTNGIQEALNTDKIIESHPFIEFGDNTTIKIARTLEDGKYKVKVKYDEDIGYIDAQTYLSMYIEKLTPQISKIGKEMVKGALLK